MDKEGARAVIGSFCSSGVISTGNNSTPVPKEAVTGKHRGILPFVLPEFEPFEQVVSDHAVLGQISET